MSEDLAPLRKSIVAKKGLGRGLGSLLGEVSSANEEKVTSLPSQMNSHMDSQMTTQSDRNDANEIDSQIKSANRIWNMAIETIRPNSEQPRKKFEQEKLQELANSIKEKGILLPIVVRKKTENEFEIIAGERRWRAAQLAGKKEVPVIIRETDNREVLELALIENIQRQDLNPIEEAEAYLVLSSKYGLTQQQIAEKVSKDRVTVANLMRLGGLTAEVKSLVRNGDLQLGQAKVLLSISEPAEQLRFAKKVIQLRLSVRATEKLLATAKEKKLKALDMEEDLYSQHEKALVSELQKLLGTKVELDISGGRSKVSVHFYSMPELNQFMDKIRSLKQ